MSSEKKNLRGYVAFWSGQLVSTFGTNVVQFAVTVWIAFATGSPLMLGYAAFFAFGTQIAFTPIAGVFVDRWSRKKVIAISDALQALAALILIYLFLNGQATVWIVIAVLAVRGGLGAFHDMAVQAIIPLMVPDRLLSRMNALNYFAVNLIGSIGPLVGALVFALLGGDLSRILWVDVITFLIAVIPTVIVRIPRVIMERSSGKKRSFRRDFGAGVSFIRETKGLTTLLSTFAIANFLLTPLGLLLPLFSIEFVAMGDTARAPILYGILVTLANAGSLVSALFMSFHKGLKRNVVGVIGGMLLGATGMLLVALSPNLGPMLSSLTPEGLLWIAAIGMTLNGLTVPIANVSSQTIWQQVVPPEKLGRVFAVRITFAQVTVPIAMLFTGYAATYFGMQFVILLCAILEILALGAAWTLTTLPHVEDTILAKKLSSQTKLGQKKAKQPDE
ncbi:MAG: MFS transporter [Candidatus Atabeyarchaeum deiterrae]